MAVWFERLTGFPETSYAILCVRAVGVECSTVSACLAALRDDGVGSCRLGPKRRADRDGHGEPANALRFPPIDYIRWEKTHERKSQAACPRSARHIDRRTALKGQRISPREGGPLVKNRRMPVRD